MNRELRAKSLKRISAIASKPFNADGLRLLLQDVRILLEELEQEDKYSQLKLHCDWVLHSKLSGSKIRKILRECDEHMDAWLTRKVLIPDSFSNRLPEALGFLGFERELAQFLHEQKVARIKTLDRGAWLAFELIYASIIRDCRLMYTDKKRPLKHIDGAIVKVIRLDEHPDERKHYAPEDYLPFGFEWIFTKHDEEVWKLTITYPTAALRERERLNPPKPHSYKDVYCWPQTPTPSA